MVEDTVDHQPFHLDAETIKLLLHVDKERILVLPLGAFVIVALPSKIHRWWLVHVSLPLVVPEHHLTIQLQLQANSRDAEERTAGFVRVSQRGTEKSTFSTAGGNRFRDFAVPVAPAPRSSASRTSCTISQRTPSPSCQPAAGGQEHQQGGQQAEGQAWGRVAPPIAMLKPSGLCPSLVDTV